MTTRNRRILLTVAATALSVGAVVLQYRDYRTPAVAVAPDAPVSASDLLPSGPGPEGMPALDDVSFESVRTADQYLKDDGYGIDVEVNGKRRFYPYQILVWHSVVNETFGGEELAVTYCPLCQGAAVYRRAIGGKDAVFSSAGRTWNGNTVLTDKESGSFWLQASGAAVDGALKGRQLETYPFRVVMWRRWKAAYPDGQVLSRNTGFDRDYTLDPALSLAGGQVLPFPAARTDAREPAKTPVVGLEAGAVHIAYNVADVSQLGVVNDVAGDVPATIWFDAETGTAAAFDRRLADSRVLTFALRAGGTIEDKETGSIWRRDGLATTGALKGRRLTPLSLRPMYWSCWAGAFHGTELYVLP